MSHATSHPARCAHPGCTANHPASKWADIRAASEGWYQARDGRQYCRLHVPAWVPAWRARKARDGR